MIDITVVSVPEPAIIGKAIGTIAPDLALVSLLKKSHPKTISNPKIKSTIEPAMAKELTSKPRSFKKLSPKKKKSKIKIPETNVALKELKPPILFFNEMSTGIEPSTSITAKSANEAVNICEKEILEILYEFMGQR